MGHCGIMSLCHTGKTNTSWGLLYSKAIPNSCLFCLCSVTTHRRSFNTNRKSSRREAVLIRSSMFQMFVVRKERATTLFGTTQFKSKVTVTFTRRTPGDLWVGVPPMVNNTQVVAAVCKTLRATWDTTWMQKESGTDNTHLTSGCMWLARQRLN